MPILTVYFLCLHTGDGGMKTRDLTLKILTSRQAGLSACAGPDDAEIAACHDAHLLRSPFYHPSFMKTTCRRVHRP